MRQRIAEWAYTNKWLAFEMSGGLFLVAAVIMLIMAKFGANWMPAAVFLCATLHTLAKKLYTFSLLGIEDEIEGHQANRPKRPRRPHNSN